MMFRMQRFESLTRNMRVNLRGGNIGVAEQQLQHPQIRAMIEQMRRECMSQCMRRKAPSWYRRRRMPFQQMPEGLSGHPAAS